MFYGLILPLAGSLVFVLALRWLLRRLAFRYMTFDVEARGQLFSYRRERFWDRNGREVTDPALIAELDAAWAKIEQRTASDVAAIHAGRNLID
jgi:hypothetical protein